MEKKELAITVFVVELTAKLLSTNVHLGSICFMKLYGIGCDFDYYSYRFWCLIEICMHMKLTILVKKEKAQCDPHEKKNNLTKEGKLLILVC